MHIALLKFKASNLMGQGVFQFQGVHSCFCLKKLSELLAIRLTIHADSYIRWCLKYFLENGKHLRIFNLVHVTHHGTSSRT